MKLKKKKTGEIGCLSTSGGSMYIVLDVNGVSLGGYNSLAELNEEWGDYEELKGIYYLTERGVIDSATDMSNFTLKMMREVGNYFKTEEEAEEAVEKLKAWKRLKDKGFRFNGGDDACISYRLDPAKWDDETEKDFDLLFGGEE